MSVCNVNIGTGAVYHIASDFFFPGRIPFDFIRDYDSTRSTRSEFGHLAMRVS